MAKSIDEKKEKDKFLLFLECSQKKIGESSNIDQTQRIPTREEIINSQLAHTIGEECSIRSEEVVRLVDSSIEKLVNLEAIDAYCTTKKDLKKRKRRIKEHFDSLFVPE